MIKKGKIQNKTQNIIVSYVDKINSTDIIKLKKKLIENIIKLLLNEILSNCFILGAALYSSNLNSPRNH